MTTDTRRDDLRTRYIRLRRTLKTERTWRDRVFPVGHPKREAKLAEIDQAIDDLSALGEAIREVLDNAPEQLKLISILGKYQ
jgi:hypothetical protein